MPFYFALMYVLFIATLMTIPFHTQHFSQPSICHKRYAAAILKLV